MSDVPDGYGSIAGIYLLGDWAVKEGKAINKWNFDGTFTYDQSFHIEYAVPTGKALYLINARGHVGHFYRADASLSHIFVLEVQDTGLSPSATIARETHDTNGIIIFDPPHIITAGNKVMVYCTTLAEHKVYLAAFLRGYLL